MDIYKNKQLFIIFYLFLYTKIKCSNYTYF